MQTSSPTSNFGSLAGAGGSALPCASYRNAAGPGLCQMVRAQDFDKAYRTIHWSNPSYTVCPKTTSALKTLVEHHGFSSDEWVAEVKRDSKGVITWRFHWGTPTSYLDTKIRLTKAITRMVELGRLLTKDELRECTVGSRQHVMKRRMDGCGAPHTPPKPRRVPLAPRLVAVGPPAREPIYDSDEDQILSAQQDGCMRRVGSQMIRYHLDRGPRPDKEQLGVMRKEFVNKKILMRTSINRIGMCDGFLCADIKIGNELLRARKWLEIQVPADRGGRDPRICTFAKLWAPADLPPHPPGSLSAGHGRRRDGPSGVEPAGACAVPQGRSRRC